MVAIIKSMFNKINFVNVQEFRQRLISTIALIILFISLLFIGNPFLTIFFSLLFSLIIIEYEKLTATLSKSLQLCKTLLLQIVLLSFTIFEIFEYDISLMFFNNLFFFLSVSILINLIFFLYNKTDYIKIILSTLIIFSFFALISILQKSNGLNLFLYVVILVSTMDIFAYLGGKLLGKIKIMPNISKGKTIEGTAIGLFATVILSILFKDLINYNLKYSLIFGFMIGILAFFGDLVESSFKRTIGVKDSGKLIPGHGGLMDRFDGYFLTLPFSYFFIN